MVKCWLSVHDKLCDYGNSFNLLKLQFCCVQKRDPTRSSLSRPFKTRPMTATLNSVLGGGHSLSQGMGHGLLGSWTR